MFSNTVLKLCPICDWKKRSDFENHDDSNSPICDWKKTSNFENHGDSNKWTRKVKQSSKRSQQSAKPAKSLSSVY